MQQLLDIASWTTWLVLACAATLGVAGVTLLAHARLVLRAGHGRLHGVYAPGAAATSLRWGLALLGLGVLLWGLELHLPALALAALAGVVTLVGGAEFIARLDASGAARRRRDAAREHA